MPGRIVFNYDNMETAAKNIDEYADEYKTAGDTLISSINAAIESWTGASKNNFNTLINGDVANYVKSSVPSMVHGLAELLRNNATTMSNADNEIAKNIPQNL